MANKKRTDSKIENSYEKKYLADDDTQDCQPGEPSVEGDVEELDAESRTKETPAERLRRVLEERKKEREEENRIEAEENARIEAEEKRIEAEENARIEAEIKRLESQREVGPEPLEVETEILLGLPVAGGLNSSTQRRSYSLDNIRKSKTRVVSAKQIVNYSGDSHLITVAPTGAGKGRGAIIPNLLTYKGPVVVVDPKGENYRVTARRRKELGQKVIRLDPFGVVDKHSDRLNPFDIFDLENSDTETDSQMLAELISRENTGQREPYWDNSARGIISGLITHIISHRDRREWNFETLRRLLSTGSYSHEISRKRFHVPKGMSDFSKDSTLIENLKETANDMLKEINPFAYSEIANLVNTGPKARDDVLSTANSYLKSLQSQKVSNNFSISSFVLDDIVRGSPLSIYLIIPPDKLRSHSTILKLWIGTILKAILSRKEIPHQKTLLMLDECAQLGHFSFLETVITLCRGYGLQTWTFWQDLGQLRNLYGDSWSTIVNNCEVIQVFGAKNHMASSSISDLFGLESSRIKKIPAEEQMLLISGSDPLQASRLDYLNDDQFSGHWDSNPFYPRR